MLRYLALLSVLFIVPTLISAQAPAGNTYNFTFTGSHSVVIATDTPNAVICITDNPSITPSSDGQGHCAVGGTYTGPLTITTTKTYRAIAGAPGIPDSPISTATYTLQAPPAPADAPVFTM